MLVVAPFAVHDAGIADLCRYYSLVASLADTGSTDLLVEWRSARRDMAGRSIRSLSRRPQCGDRPIGDKPDLVGLCQGGWMSLVPCRRLPGKVRGAASPARRSTRHFIGIAEARLRSGIFVDQTIAAEGGVCRRRASGRASGGAGRISEIPRIASPATARPARPGSLGRHARFARRYYRQVAAWLFRENWLARDGGLRPADAAVAHRMRRSTSWRVSPTASPPPRRYAAVLDLRRGRRRPTAMPRPIAAISPCSWAREHAGTRNGGRMAPAETSDRASGSRWKPRSAHRPAGGRDDSASTISPMMMVCEPNSGRLRQPAVEMRDRRSASVRPRPRQPDALRERSSCAVVGAKAKAAAMSA